MKEMLKLRPNKNGYTHLRVETDYTLGGMNYFSYRNVSRGYYLYVTPITYHVHESGGCSYGTWSTQLGCGLKLLLKAVSRRDKGSGLMIHFFAELIGRNVKIIVDQCRCTGLRLRIVEMRVRLYPRIQNCKIFAHDLPVAGKHFIAVTAKGPTYWRAVFDTFAIYGLIHNGYPMPTDLSPVETDENGSAVDPTDTFTDTTDTAVPAA